MRKWKCVKSNSIYFTIGRIYETDENGDGLTDDSNSGRRWTNPWRFKLGGFNGASFEEVFNKVKEEEKKVNKFKVGDIVVGNNSHRYGYTNKGVKCEIIRILRDEKIEVRIIDNSYKGDVLFVVEPEYFDLTNPLNSKSLTITTSDSTTTLSDGTHTTSINRYYTDKHDVKVAVNEVVKKYFDEVEMEEKKSKMPKVGDKVMVVDNGRTHSTYDEWLIKNNVNLKSAIKWKNGLSPENGGEYVIKEIHKHEYYDADLALIEDAENAYIINIEGLEVIK